MIRYGSGDTTIVNPVGGGEEDTERTQVIRAPSEVETQPLPDEPAAIPQKPAPDERPTRRRRRGK